ncbi:conserved hypothetical protein [Xanthomonas citri pv. citri]|uniref:Uncharacterized protein n=1 Tax=Xanthomonas citri pv. citri TaxID=611301 RepID=A0A0U5FFL3_XANCI|nr:conserved hypothetical protein [Xanthomonas citri pv. citri]CEE31757.1 conserved hypothetical protein [Xanthomonas citri pv. citri]CEE43229.1 conserved hypothetical protein [Xanthomonas citri pv. citri]CEE44054.1 conserved hypothetical protein [Xanthomonas citri pv. citri]CEE73151.1 conserved hypothetical protein [Xanthomonas citri pv. citri]
MRAWPVQASPGHSGAERAVRTRMTTGRDVLLAFWTAVHVLERSGARRCFPKRLTARKRSGWVQVGAWKVGSILNQSSTCRRAAHRAPADIRTCACRLAPRKLPTSRCTLDASRSVIAHQRVPVCIGHACMPHCGSVAVAALCVTAPTFSLIQRLY